MRPNQVESSSYTNLTILAARAQYMLTEVGHGLDARNLETTATLLPNGDFDLHTPNFNAAK